MKYELLAIDVDGTLTGADNTISPEVAEAVAAADAAGLRIVLATGRSYVETIPIWRRLNLGLPHEPMILIGGAMVSEPDTGRTLYQRAIRRDLACRYADALGEAGYSALAIVDAWRHGVDYFVAESDDAEIIHRRWFSRMNVKVRRLHRLDEADDMPDPLRINAVVDAENAPALAKTLKLRFAGQLNIHAIFAPNYDVTIVEAFAAGTDKWKALKYVAGAYRIGPGRIVAIGDDINDLPMIRHAGLGVATALAPPQVKTAAKHVAADGVADFLHRLITDKLPA